MPVDSVVVCEVPWEEWVGPDPMTAMSDLAVEWEVEVEWAVAAWEEVMEEGEAEETSKVSHHNKFI